MNLLTEVELNGYVLAGDVRKHWLALESGLLLGEGDTENFAVLRVSHRHFFLARHILQQQQNKR